MKSHTENTSILNLLSTKLRSRTLRKLRSNRGESISEVLVALLISSLALVMLASMISSTTSLVTKSRDVLSEYYDANNALSSRGSSGSGAASSPGTAVLSGGSLGDISKAVTVYENGKFGSAKVYSYTVGAVPASSGSSTGGG